MLQIKSTNNAEPSRPTSMMHCPRHRLQPGCHPRLQINIKGIEPNTFASHCTQTKTRQSQTVQVYKYLARTVDDARPVENGEFFRPSSFFAATSSSDGPLTRLLRVRKQRSLLSNVTTSEH